MINGTLVQFAKSEDIIRARPGEPTGHWAGPYTWVEFRGHSLLVSPDGKELAHLDRGVWQIEDGSIFSSAVLYSKGAADHI